MVLSPDDALTLQLAGTALSQNMGTAMMGALLTLRSSRVHCHPWSDNTASPNTRFVYPAGSPLHDFGPHDSVRRGEHLHRLQDVPPCAGVQRRHGASGADGDSSVR